MKTLAAGQSYELSAHGSTDRASSFKPMSLPDGVYMTQISNQQQTAFGVDNQGRLWTWGYSIYGQTEEEDRNFMYEGEYSNTKPMLVKWFRDQTIKVLDVKSGDHNAIIKAEDKDGNIVFYGMSRTAEYLKRVGGTARLKEEYKHYIQKLEVQGDRVQDFAVGKEAAYLLMAADKQEIKSIDPDHPESKGLIHFYQTPEEAEGGKKWKFLTSEEYEAQKDTLPDVCFATRHPINSLLERVKRERANNATEEDRSDTSFPDLNTILAQM